MSRGIKINNEMYMEVPFQLDTLTELKIVRQFNEHSYICLRGTASETEEENILSLDDGTQICLYSEAEGQSKLIFSGIPVEVNFAWGGTREVYVKAAGNSIRMDWEKKSRSFQRGDIHWEDVAEEILKDYGGDFLSREAGLKPCDFPLIQDRETDWEFIKRIGRGCKKPVYITDEAEDIKLYMGYGSKDTADLSLKDGEVKKRLSDHLFFMKKAGATSNEITESICQIESRDSYNLGQTVSSQGKEYCITKIEGELMQGQFSFRYHLKQTDCPGRERRDEAVKYRGRSLCGTVLAVEKEKIKLHLDIDPEQAEECAHWYPWHRNDWFCMPEIGAKAALLLPEAGEEGAYVAAVIRGDGGENPRTQDPDSKWMETEDQKGWGINEDSMTFYALEGDIYMELSDSGDITMESAEGINISGKKIKISSPKISLKSREKIWLATKRNSIVMDDIIQMKG